MIGIKNMQMPKDCNTCRFCDWDHDCFVNDPPVSYRHAPGDGRPDWCPLIDLDAYMNDGK